MDERPLDGLMDLFMESLAAGGEIGFSSLVGVGCLRAFQLLNPVQRIVDLYRPSFCWKAVTSAGVWVFLKSSESW